MARSTLASAWSSAASSLTSSEIAVVFLNPSLSFWADSSVRQAWRGLVLGSEDWV